MRTLRFVFFAIGVCAAVRAQVVINPLPSRVFGNPSLRIPAVTVAPNLVEGRELNGPQSVAVDTSSSPNILYVADTGNNRVLAFRIGANLIRGNTADRVIGQRDLQSTLPQGPQSGAGGLSSGLSLPTAVAVDRQGNLYVADAGNNRILRYPRPLDQTGSLLPVDLVIGQRTVSSGVSPNQGLATPNDRTVAFTSAGVFRLSMAFDRDGNLWVTDSGNNRVLRYPVSQLAANTSEPAADRVLGQFDFNSRNQPTPPAGATTVQVAKTGLVQPSGLAFDASGNLYVSDGFSRVLYYAAPFTNGKAASRVLGVLIRQPNTPVPAYPNATALGLPNAQGAFAPPEGLAVVGNNLWVADTPNNRLVKYDAPEQWPAETDAAPSPNMRTVFAQVDFLAGRPNGGRPDPTSGSLAAPVQMFFANNEMWVADSGNHRVLSLPVQGDTFGGSSRLIGQAEFDEAAPNLLEGREAFFLAGNVASAGIAIDRRSSPPRLYVADALNNRVLGFRDARNVRPGDRADIVIGQTGFNKNLVNSPSDDATQFNDTGLNSPSGLAVDGDGNLFVADTGNGRVLRYPAPFAQTVQRPNLVLGQANFFTRITDASSATLRNPYGLAIFFDGSIAVSDVSHNRVVLYRKPAGGDFRNGQDAALVFGQPDFNTVAAGNTATRMNAPRHIATDTDDRLYVTDSGNNRVHIYTRAPAAGSDPAPAVTLSGFSAPQGIFVSSRSGEVWVANTSASEVRRYPEFSRLLLNPDQVLSRLSVPLPLALALDDNDNPVFAEGINRVSFYYAALTFQNAASYSTTRLAPGQLAYLYRLGLGLDVPTASAEAYPWPTVLGEYQVSFNGTPARIFRLVPSRIDFQVPRNAPTSGLAEVQISKTDGQVIAVGQVQMDRGSPSLFTANQQGTGQISAINQDGSINSPSNPVPRGQVISLYGTGVGVGENGPVGGYPEDGEPAPGPVRIPENLNFLRVIINDGPAEVQYSGLAPGFVGLWQINAVVGMNVPPSNSIPVGILLYDIRSTDGPGNPPTTLRTTISVR
jgi:uncharacterized protein (TIGR03437 family)